MKVDIIDLDPGDLLVVGSYVYIVVSFSHGEVNVLSPMTNSLVSISIQRSRLFLSGITTHVKCNCA